MSVANPHVVVLGAGVAGLSCAVVLGRAGLQVAIVTADAPAGTTSAVAGGLWFPYGHGPEERTLDWARAGYARYEGLAGDHAAGVEMVDYLLLGRGDPWWAEAMPAGRVRPAREDELPPGYGDGHVARVPLVQTPRHLGHLVAEATALGATFERRRVASFDELGAPAVVDCAGLGARELCGDATLQGVRGQVVHLRPATGARVPCVADDDGPNALAYVLPRPDVCVVGGTAEPAREATTDLATREAILDRCRAIAPGLAGAEVLGDHAGLRPVREGGVRLEAEDRDGMRIVHDYGHGGAGWTLAWGCAGAVRDLLLDGRVTG